MKTSLGSLLSAVVITIGIGFAGWFIADGLREARTGDRFVTVKGLAEREVKADLALWPMRFVATSNTLDEAQAKSRADAEVIIAFLGEAGISRGEIAVQSLEVTDLLAQPYRSGPVESRFIVAQTLMVRSRESIASPPQASASAIWSPAASSSQAKARRRRPPTSSPDSIPSSPT